MGVSSTLPAGFGPEDVPRWRTPATDLALGPGTVEVWRAELDRLSPELEQLLCAQELLRAGRFAARRAGSRWARGRGLLRRLLARHLACDPREVRFALGPHGKPTLILEEGRPPPLHFNLSHSGGLALYALSVTSPVGIDVEVDRREHDEAAVAARVLGAQEAQRLNALEPGERRRAFLQAWTRHEAVLKCAGAGLSGTGVPARVQPWVVRLDPGPGAAAALAVELAPRELRCLEAGARGGA